MGSQNHNKAAKSWDSLIKNGCDDVNNSNLGIILVIGVFTDEELKLWYFFNFEISGF